ncbi:MAG: SUMF1/EgtB/PvdO family nonheme iron enzyme [Verrucomicrobia bacterium]|nr:SUMF1/EgtB/PvdO family nonheme iron enzyme [Verrucomicrobiota bacterium]
MKTNFNKVVWLGCVMGTVVFNGSVAPNVCADEQLNPPAAAKPKTVSAAVIKPAATAVKPEEKKREYKADTNPGTIFTNSIDMLLVRLSAGYWVGKFEVTQEQYKKVMNSNPSAFPGDGRPVDSVTYDEAVEFCRQLNEIERKEESLPKGYIYALPTEAQWESFVGNAGLETAVTSFGQRRSGTENVGSLAPNESGLYDVRGNVMEWCAADPSKPYRVLRGGAWATTIEINLRPAFRHYARPDERQNTFGFRVVLVSE